MFCVTESQDRYEHGEGVGPFISCSLSVPNLSQDYKYMYIKSIDQIFIFILIGDIL